MEQSGASAHEGTKRRFDRRTAIKGLLGLGGVIGATTLFRSKGDAARRGYGGPTLPAPPTQTPTPAGGGGNSGSDGI